MARKASHSDGATWRAFYEAHAAYSAKPQHWDGIGFMLGDGWTGVDFDHCVEDDKIASWASDAIELVHSYTEFSPSGTGLHTIAKGTLPTGRRRTGMGDPRAIEMYDGLRYFTVTGHTLNGYSEVKERTTELAELHSRVFPKEPAKPKPQQSSITLDDQEVIHKAENAKNGAKFKVLWSGDISGYPSESEADLALCGILRFWTQDGAQIDRIFRGSGLMRDKWDKVHYADGSTYGQGTIAKVLSGGGETYQGQRVASSKETDTTQPAPAVNTAEVLEPLLFPKLPESARVNPALGKDACPWLDDYIAFSRKWSPRSFAGYHENTAIWVLSTTAARRVVCHYGQPRYTNLETMLLGRTTIHGKSSAVGIGDQLLRDAGLAFLLSADESTPASFVKSLSDKTLPSDFDAMDSGRQEEVLARLGFAGQRGWYYEEFGSGLSSMMRPDGTMADFRGLLRRLDDCPETYERATIARGSERIERPYLALIANLTPADMKPLARKGSQLWGDGFLARFNFVTPPAGEILRGQYPKNERVIPPGIIAPLVEWHTKLGMPDVQLVQKQDKDGDPVSERVEVGPFPQTTLAISDAVFDASYRYFDALMDIAERSTLDDLDGCLGRFHVKALRVALLFASFEGSATIELRHWARAQEIAERWRLYTYRAYEQVTTLDWSEEAQIQDDILDRIRKLEAATAVDLGRYIKSLSTPEIADRCDRMVGVGLLEFEETRKHTKRYFLPGRIVEKEKR